MDQRQLDLWDWLDAQHSYDLKKSRAGTVASDTGDGDKQLDIEEIIRSLDHAA